MAIKFSAGDTVRDAAADGAGHKLPALFRLLSYELMNQLPKDYWLSSRGMCSHNLRPGYLHPCAVGEYRV